MVWLSYLDSSGAKRNERKTVKEERKKRNWNQIHVKKKFLTPSPCAQKTHCCAYHFHSWSTGRYEWINRNCAADSGGLKQSSKSPNTKLFLYYKTFYHHIKMMSAFIRVNENRNKKISTSKVEFSFNKTKTNDIPGRREKMNYW